MDFDEFFNPTTKVEYNFNDGVVRHYFTELDSETDMAYQRRVVTANRSSIGNGKVPDAALDTEIWLYNKLCRRVEVKNGNGAFEEVPNFREVIPPGMKRRAIFDYQRRITEAKDDGGGEGNS